LASLSRQFNDSGVNHQRSDGKLRTLMRQLAKVEGVHDVERI